ncbi:MAG: metallopeptidase family protein [Actinobacteria bacterium]|nr:metallopeptidase family protein [Actinomycetota bacterium]MCB8996538.1 metallopeptidase family protein [Actinomycetota bacterium]HRY08554.1 metallopeptidase family protein [Candidatus Nanopelagicales bacterium]
MIDVSPERFEQLVEAAVNVIPEDLARYIDNVAIVVEDDAPAEDPHLLGLYEGVPLTARGSWYIAAMPDRIRIFRLPILRMCQSQAEVVREVYITVVHEIAHHFGIDDATLHDLGVG